MMHAYTPEEIAEWRSELTAAGVAPITAVPEMRSHEHVTLDEEVFHAYQEIWLAATYLPSPDASMRMALAHLEDALKESAEHCAADPFHHAPSPGAAE